MIIETNKPIVDYELTDTCDYQNDVLYYHTNILINGKKFPTVLKLDLNDTIYDYFKYGDGYMKIQLKKLICK